LADDSKTQTAEIGAGTADVGARYAVALLDLADEAGALAAVEKDVKAFRAMLAESADLRRLVASPAFGADAKAAGVNAVAEAAGLDALTRKFIGLIARNGRVAALPAALAAFERLAAEKRGAVAAEVTSAVKLSVAQQKGIASALRQVLGKDPELTVRVDPALLGGLKVKVGSRLYDASLKSRLDNLKHALKRA
jgi:F-type H+-transporting ATPase subunit delta